MKQLRAWLLRLKGLFLKNARERELAAEIESHLQMHIDDNLRAGMAPEQAKRVAIMKLGGVDSTKEAYRDRSTIPFLENLLQDLRFTVRQCICIVPLHGWWEVLPSWHYCWAWWGCTE